MHCATCQAQLPDIANYCLKSGEPTANAKGQARKSNRPIQVLLIEELTKVAYTSVLLFGPANTTTKYYAKVGKRVIDETRWTDTEKSMPMLTEMIARLLNDGWEIMTTDEQGRVVTMRR